MKSFRIFTVSFIFSSILLFLSSCAGSHFIKSGSIDEIQWGVSQETVLSKIDSSYKNVSDITPSIISYKINYTRNLMSTITITVNTEQYSYLFNEKNQLYSIKIAYNTGIGSNPTEKARVIRRNNQTKKKLIGLLGKPDFSKKSDKRIKLIKSSNMTWKAKSERKIYPNTKVNTRYSVISGNGTSWHTFTESYFNNNYKPKTYNIHQATLMNDVSKIKSSIDAGQNINKKIKVILAGKSYEKATPLFVAIMKKKTKAAQFLINKGAALNVKYNIKGFNGNSLLIFAIATKLEKVALRMIGKGADVNAKIEGGKLNKYTAIHVAAETGNTKLIKALLKKGADIEAKTKSNMTPIIIAMSNKKDDATILLINKGAKIDYSKKINGRPLLFVTIARKMEKVGLLLIEKGANVNEEIKLKNFNGNSQLIFTILTKQYKLAKAMIKKGADVNAKLNDGALKNYTPLHAAAEIKNIELVKLLLKKGADKNAKTAKGKTPAQSTRSKKIKELLGS